MSNASQSPRAGERDSCARDQRPTDPAPSAEPYEYPIAHMLSDMEGSLLSLICEIGDALTGGIDATEEEPGLSLAGSRKMMEEASANILSNAAAIERTIRELRRRLREKGIR